MYICKAWPNCLRLERQSAWSFFCFARANADSNRAARIAMTAITTSSSIRLKARLRCSSSGPITSATHFKHAHTAVKYQRGKSPRRIRRAADKPNREPICSPKRLRGAGPTSARCRPGSDRRDVPVKVKVVARAAMHRRIGQVTPPTDRGINVALVHVRDGVEFGQRAELRQLAALERELLPAPGNRTAKRGCRGRDSRCGSTGNRSVPPCRRCN